MINTKLINQMKPQIKDVSELTDQELIEIAKKQKKESIIDAFLIGFLFAILIVSIIFAKSFILVLCLLYPIYKLAKKPKYKKADIDQQLKARNLI